MKSKITDSIELLESESSPLDNFFFNSSNVSHEHQVSKRRVMAPEKY